MAGDHHDFLVETVNSILDGSLYLLRVSAPKVGSTNRVLEQGIACNQELMLCKVKAHRPRRMTRRVHTNARAVMQVLIIAEPVIRIRHRRVGNTEHLTLCFQMLP